MPKSQFFALRPDKSDYTEYMHTYVSKVPDVDVVAYLREQIDQLTELFKGMTDEQACHRYAPGKWSLKQIIGHLSDAERVFVYRALRFARSDTTALPGFDEDDYVDNANFDDRSLADLLTEWVATRKSTLTFFSTLPETAWDLSGTASQNRFTVRALAFVTAGHVEHHRRIILERYLNTTND